MITTAARSSRGERRRRRRALRVQRARFRPWTLSTLLGMSSRLLLQAALCRTDRPRSDAEDGPLAIAEQMKLNERRDQEECDRQLALQLSQESEARPSRPEAAIPDEANALSKLMATSRANSRARSAFHPTSPDPEPMVGGQGQTQSSEAGAALSTAAGYWPPTVLGFSPPGPSRVPGAVLSAPQASPLTPQGAALSTVPPGTWNGPSGPAQPALPLPGWPSHGFPSQMGLPTTGMSGADYGRVNLPSLVDTINRTNAYDYSTYSDEHGDALPDRLTNFLEEAYHDPRVTEQEISDLLQNIRPDMEIPERNRDGTPAGLKGALYLHQELALTWMKQMEAGSNKGGILADDMGLGKTISTLALMLDRPASARPKVSPRFLAAKRVARR